MLQSSKTSKYYLLIIIFVHYPLIDFYRYFSALIVCVSHFVLYWNKSVQFEFASIIGIELFFVLSGFVLASQILKLETNPKKYLKTFLLRRWIRTVPPYVVALFAAAILFDYGDQINFLKFLTYTQNILTDDSLPNFFPVAWSLSVEEWFYIYLPLLIFFFSTINFSNTKPSVLTICITTILLLNLFRFFYNGETINWTEDIRRSVLLRIDSLCFGVVAYIFKDKIGKKFLIFFIFITIIPLAYFLLEPSFLIHSILAQNAFFPLCSICFSSVLILLTYCRNLPNIFISLGSFGANVSYSMYLSHIFFIHIIINIFDNLILALPIYFLSLTVFCWIFFNYFEKPLLKSRPKYN